MSKLIQEGPRNAKIVIVGEAPGAKEAETGRPFIGGSGELLSRMLSNVGISRSECFITNVCHVRPEGNKFEWFYRKGNTAHLALGMLQLKKDLESIKPNLVIALGAQPLKVLTGKSGIDSWRGSILSCCLVPEIKVIATYHPAYILRIWDYKAVAEFDLRRASKEAKFPEIRRPKRDFYLDPPVDVRASLIEEMIVAEWLSIDIECVPTDHGGWRLSCVGFSDRADRALVIPINGPSDVADVRRLCGAPNKKVFQNGTFDCTVLRDNGILVENFAWDTMLGHHSLYPECASGGDEISAHSGKKRQSALAKGLAFQTSIYTDEPYYKADGKLWKATNDLQMFWRYNALDAAVTREIRDIQERELKDFGTLGVLEHEMSLVEPLMCATRAGIKVDQVVRTTLTNTITAEIDRLQNFLDSQAGTSVNVKSNKQMVGLLYDQLKLPGKYNRKSGNLTADKDAIASLGERHNHPLLHTIIGIRERRDLLERYLQVKIDPDGHMRCSFDITGTRTGRLASRASLSGSGTNLQNIPEGIRLMFVAKPGHSFVYMDYKQAEAQVVAYLARSDSLIELFEDAARDVHKENAARIFGVPLQEVDKNKRYLAKRIIHASNYGMGEKRFMEIVNQDAQITGVRINKTEARSLLERYFLLYPEIREVFWKDIEVALRSTRVLDTPFGRKRTFFGRFDDKLLKEAYAFVPQSTVGDLCCKALVNCHSAGLEVLLNVHDSLLVQCADDQINSTIVKMVRAMAIPITIHDREFIIPTDCKVGKNWGNHSDKNPEGLADV
jgi:DNA polymerase I